MSVRDAVDWFGATWPERVRVFGSLLMAYTILLGLCALEVWFISKAAAAWCKP